MKKLVILVAAAYAIFVGSPVVAQMCGGSIIDLLPNTPSHANTCGSHLEITSGCWGTFNGKGASVFRLRLASGHSAIRVSGGASSFHTSVSLANAFDGSGCSGYCYSPDVDETTVYTIRSTDPAGTYYVTIGDLISESPGCGDVTAEADGDFGLSDQYISFTSPRPTNAQAGGSYTVTAAASSGLPVYLDVDVTSTSSCQISGSSSGSVVTYTHPGTCIIRANQSGDGEYFAAAQVIQSFDVSVGPPAQVEFDQSPPNGIAGVPLSSSVEVDELDAFRNLESGDSISTISLVANGPGHLRGEPVTAVLTKGVAIFSSDLILDTAGIYTLTAASNASGTSSVRSAKFSIMPSTAGAMLQFDSALPSTIERGQTLGRVTVTETDQFGNRMASDNSTTITLLANSCAGLSLGFAPLTAGQVTFDTTQAFHSETSDVMLTAEPTSTSGPVSATAHFGVTSSPDFVFFSGLESCEP
jgi:hypothetical protein